MTGEERAVLRVAQHLVALARQLAHDLAAGGDVLRGPVHWPDLADERPQELENLRSWVGELLVRFPNLAKPPRCWWQHNDLVEILAALRDSERGCYASTAPLTGPVEWHRLMHDVELRMSAWMKRFACGISQPGHVEPVAHPGEQLSTGHRPNDETETMR